MNFTHSPAVSRAVIVARRAVIDKSQNGLLSLIVPLLLLRIAFRELGIKSNGTTTIQPYGNSIN